jgi:multiple sugar transport system substrate-binding protein
MDWLFKSNILYYKIMDENVAQELQETELTQEPASANGSAKKKIISLIVGLFIIVTLAVLAIVFILPMFQNKGVQEVELVYWGTWEDPQAFREIIDEFRKLHPNINIKYERQDLRGLGKYIDRLSTRIENGTGPDIFRYHNSWLPQLIRPSPLLLPFPSDVVNALEMDKFYKVVQEDLKAGGAYYGVPIQFDTLALFVNVQSFAAAGIAEYPSTWDDLGSAARKLTVKDSEGRIISSGVALGTYDNIAHASDIISLLLIQNGADLLDLNGESKQNAYDAFDFYTSFAKGDAKVWDDTLDNSKLAFAKGNLAMYFGYSWDIFIIKALNPNLEFAVVPVPSLPSRNATIASYWVEGVSSRTKFSKEAFEFLKFLARRETMEKMYSKEARVRLFGSLYPRSDMADLLKTNTLIYPFVAQGEIAVSTIFSSDTHDDAMVKSLNSYLGNAVRAIINENSSPQSAVETLAAGVSQVLSKYAVGQ